MTDTVIKGTGNSRTIKAAPATLPATYDEFRAKFISSGIPIDLLGLNAAGLTTRGTDLNKTNLLTDALCSALGLSTTATPTQAMDKLRQLVATAQYGVDNGPKVEIGSYTGTGTYGENNPTSIVFGFAPRVVFMFDADGIPITWYSSSMGDGYIRVGITDPLTTSYKKNVCFYYYSSSSGGSTNNYMMMKKNSTGRTLTWYVVTTVTESYRADVQMNGSGKTYRYLAIR